MKVFILSLFILSTCHTLNSQDLTGSELLEKAIQYHDPDAQWNTFSGTFDIIMEMPEKSKRISRITIDLPKEYFKVSATRDTVVTEYTVNKGECTIRLNGNSNLTKTELFSNNLSCERAEMYKNYYTYLYGLPMKLKDEGTLISERVDLRKFRGKDYLVLQVTYDESVGNDIWYFYFDPETFAMEVYQFFKTDAQGKMKSKSGEFIMLSDIEIVNGIKIPRVRTWYYNKDESYLATDILSVNSD